eukprot:4438009-Prymnesium_polylepis.1
MDARTQAGRSCCARPLQRCRRGHAIKDDCERIRSSRIEINERSCLNTQNPKSTTRARHTPGAPDREHPRAGRSWTHWPASSHTPRVYWNLKNGTEMLYGVAM